MILLTLAKASAIRLIRVADLMVRYKVGVLVRSVVELKEVDEGFFER